MIQRGVFLRGRTGRYKLVVIAVLSAIAIPGTGFAGTEKAPFAFGGELSLCQTHNGAHCTNADTADATSGAMQLDDQVGTSLPATGVTVGIAFMGGAFYNQTARRSVPVSITFKIDSAAASTPTPYSTALTGSYAEVLAGAGGIMPQCETCQGFTLRTIVSQGAPPPMPTIPPPLPKLPGLPPALPKLPSIPPAAPSAPNLPGQAGPMTLTLKFTITNRAGGLVPAGVVGIFIGMESRVFLGGGKSPLPAYLGPQPPMNDVGTSRGAIKSTLVSVSY